jgi:hypothetical protein
MPKIVLYAMTKDSSSSVFYGYLGNSKLPAGHKI